MADLQVRRPAACPRDPLKISWIPRTSRGTTNKVGWAERSDAQQIKGFTLLEILIVFVIIAILIISVVPTYREFLIRSEEDIAREELLRAIHLARNESALYGGAVTLCPSGNQQTCSGNWQQEKILFLDATAKGALTEPTQLLYVFKSHKVSGQLYWRGALSREFLSVSAISTYQENGTFWYCAPKQPHARWAIILNEAGRARLADDTELNSLTCAA